MLPGMIQIHDLNGAGEVLVGQIPDPDGPVSQDHFGGGPLSASAPSLRIDAEAELFSGFDGSYVAGGVRGADRPAFLVHGGLREHLPSLHSRVRARCPSILPVRPSVSAATTGTWTPSISTYIFGIFCLETTGKTSCLARPISCWSRWAISAPMASAARSMALAVTSRPASSFIGSHPGANGISLPTTASMRLTPGEDSRPAMPSSVSAGYCPVEQSAHRE